MEGSSLSKIPAARTCRMYSYEGGEKKKKWTKRKRLRWKSKGKSVQEVLLFFLGACVRCECNDTRYIPCGVCVWR